jgi:BirA family biotin operon repressor/biotin-[acetyl-CoA-carboxylase] ligase
MAFTLGPRAQAQGYQLASFPSLGSTNSEALDRARGGERGPQWVVTSEQTAGRGRRQRTWSSPVGNLAASILEVVDVGPAVAATLGFAAGLALEDALGKMSVEASMRASGMGGVSFRLKWPNDVLAADRKLSGILLEAEAVNGGLAVVVGMGTNVVAAPEGTPYPATSLASLGVHVSAEDLFKALSDSWAEYRGIWDNGRGFDDIRRRWLDRAAGLGEPVSIQSGATLVEGIFETIDATGCMIVIGHDGRRVSVAAGDVYFGKAKSAGAA